LAPERIGQQVIRGACTLASNTNSALVCGFADANLHHALMHIADSGMMVLSS